MVRDRRAYLRVRKAVITIQAYTRGMYTRRIYWEVHRTNRNLFALYCLCSSQQPLKSGPRVSHLLYRAIFGDTWSFVEFTRESIGYELSPISEGMSRNISISLSHACGVCNVCFRLTSPFTAVPAAPQGHDHPEEGPRLAAEEKVPACACRRHCHPVRVQACASQTAAEAAEDRGAFGAAPEEAQHRHGEQDCSAAEEDG